MNVKNMIDKSHITLINILCLNDFTVSFKLLFGISIVLYIGVSGLLVCSQFLVSDNIALYITPVRMMHE